PELCQALWSISSKPLKVKVAEKANWCARIHGDSLRVEVNPMKNKHRGCCGNACRVRRCNDCIGIIPPARKSLDQLSNRNRLRCHGHLRTAAVSDTETKIALKTSAEVHVVIRHHLVGE